MYEKTAGGGSLAAAGTLPFTGLSLTAILAVAVALLVLGAMIPLVMAARAGKESA
jgi:hypothetical protein